MNNNLLKTFAIALLLFFFVPSQRVISSKERKIALLPFQNIGGQIDSETAIFPLIKKAIEAKGYVLADEKIIEEYLFSERVRDTTLISNKEAYEIKQKVGAEVIMVGVIDLLAIAPDNPQLGLSARLLDADDGSVLWANYAGATGDDFTLILGIRKIKSIQKLAVKVVNRLFRDLPRADAEIKKKKPKYFFSATRLFSGARYFFRDESLKKTSSMKIAILPFENLTERKGAGKVITDLFIISMYKMGKCEILNPGEVQSALLDVAIWHYGGISFEGLSELTKKLKCDAVILGSVEGYNEGIKKGGETFWPEVMLSARMLDSKTGKILWSCFHARKGEDSQIALDFGIIRSIVPLAAKAIWEMLYTF